MQLMQNGHETSAKKMENYANQAQRHKQRGHTCWYGNVFSFLNKVNSPCFYGNLRNTTI